MIAGDSLEDLAGRIGQRLLAHGETLAVAETSAGGLIGAVLARQVDSPGWLAGSIVAYAPVLQTTWLSVAPETIKQFGAVSPEVARALAEGVRGKLGTTWGIAETGIAGPQTGRRSRKPAGLVYLAVVGPTRGVSRHFATGYDLRIPNKEAFARGALELLLATLDDRPWTVDGGP